MKFFAHQKGQSLIEILFAIAIFTLGVVTIGYLMFDSFASLAYKEDTFRARLLAQEGLEAVRTLRDDSYAHIPAGTYGLTMEEGVWELTSAPDLHDIFARTIVITDLSPEEKEVISNIVWEKRGEQKSLALQTRFSNWRSNEGMARDVSVDINNVQLYASSTRMGGIALLNEGSEDSVLDAVTVQWEGGALLQEIYIRDSGVYTASSSSVASGESVDISDYIVSAASGFHLVDLVFDGSVAATDFVVTFTFTDASVRHVVIEYIP